MPHQHFQPFDDDWFSLKLFSKADSVDYSPNFENLCLVSRTGLLLYHSRRIKLFSLFKFNLSENVSKSSYS